MGRIPVIVSLSDLDKDALVRIISEPKNSLVKQYIKLFSMEGVELKFYQKALDAIAEKALERNTGARGLRSIMEEIMLSLMYEIPSEKDVSKVIITEACVKNGAKPKIIRK